MKVAIYRCKNDHVRFFTTDEAIARDQGEETIYNFLPVRIPGCPVLGWNGGAIPSACNEDLRLFGTFEVESPL